MSPQSPPPTAGAVDLGALKGPTREQKNALIEQLLRNDALLCPCGERIRAGGVSLILIHEGMLPSPTGPQPGIQFMTGHFHGLDCPALAGELSVERTDDMPKPIAIRALAPVQWVDEVRQESNSPVE